MVYHSTFKTLYSQNINSKIVRVHFVFLLCLVQTRTARNFHLKSNLITMTKSKPLSKNSSEYENLRL